MSLPKRVSLMAAVCFGLLVTLFSLSLIAAEGPRESRLPELEPRVSAQKPVQTTISPNANIAYVVVKFVDPAKVRLRSGSMVSFNNRSLKAVNEIVAPLGSQRVRRLMGEVQEQTLDREREVLQFKTGRALADMNAYYRIDVSSASEAEELVNRLNGLDVVEIAYAQPMPEPAGDIDPPTGDFESGQLYLDPAPAGVDADWARTQPGGDGSGVKIVDIEGAWQETHEDLPTAVGGLIGGTEINDLDWRNHGTAVIGVMVGADNGYGVTGIVPAAEIGFCAIGSRSMSEAVMLSLEELEPGDLILIELHAPGPRYNFESRSDQLGYVCMEYWQDSFDALQYAWARGIVVCEAAGNGAENFDDAIYGSLFDTTYRNSHAIMCGAGYPASSSNNLQRHGFSNYGERVNLQGYGSGVYTTGYGGLFNGGGDENQYYTAGFSGTSSASPIVTGSAAALQGWYKANHGVVLTSDQIRELLAATGTPQQGSVWEHIGPRPNLFAAINAATAPPSLYATPILIDTSVSDGSLLTTSVWLYNRSNTTAVDFDIEGNDNWEQPTAPDWLTTSPSSGTISPSDSVEVVVSLDASLLEDQPEAYKGLLDVSWSAFGLPLDSTTLVPVYMLIECNDLTWAAAASDEPEGPVFDWISAKDLGNRVPNSAFNNQPGADPLDDGTSDGLLLGFDFPFYDSVTYNRAYVGVNGALSFTDAGLDFDGFFGDLNIPGNDFSTIVSAFWNDLIIDQVRAPDAGVYLYKTPGLDTAVIEWHKVSSFNAAADTTITFQVILTKYGEIVLQYLDVGVTGLENSATIGVSEIGCRALNYFDNGAPAEHTVADGMRVELTNTTRQLVLGGDWDGDGAVSPIDLSAMVDYSFSGGPGPTNPWQGDVNCDGTVDPIDIAQTVDYLFAGGPGPCKQLIYF